MATLSLASLAKSMKEIDICMFTTLTSRAGLNSRPMSNNRDVTWKGDSYFFTFEKSKKIKELEANPNVILNFEGKSDLYMNVSGKAKLIRDKQAFADHWVPDLDRWFQDGIDTKGLVLIHVKGTKIHYWQKEKEGEIKVGGKAK
jgi:general stress protein 26